MAVHGYITHAARNRPFTAWLVLGYLAAFQLIGAFALTLVLLLADPEHTILSDPIGYAVRYTLPIAALTGFMFWRMYSGHARAVTRALDIRIVARVDEPRFVQIAEEQCTALGVRLPRFGIIEADEPNAVTVGEGPTRGLIAVTRGLLDRLDDDELAAVLAHEASHIRHGDTKLLAANHALMRTAVIMQTHNPLRFEDWRQMIIPVVMPPMLMLMLAGGAATMLSMRLSRAARRGLKLSRDYIADGEAIRVTHFPEALASALAKVGGRGSFQGSYRVEGMLFDGPADHEGGSHPAINDRIDAINTLGRDLMSSFRTRRDSRVPTQPAFGRRPRAAAAMYPLDASGRPLERPAPPSRVLWLYFTNREAFWQWQNACIAWYEWRLSDGRNAIGLTPKLMALLGATFAVALFIYWPANGNLSRLVSTFNPTEMVSIARMVNSGPFCSGPSYPDGKCPSARGAKATTDQPAGRPATSNSPAIRPAGGDRVTQDGDRALLPPATVPVMLTALIIIAIVRPSFLRFLVGAVEPKKDNTVEMRSASIELQERGEANALPASSPFARRQTDFKPAPPARSFGRRNSSM